MTLKILLLSGALACSALAGDPRIALDSEFPDPDGATWFSGELTLVEHVNRRGILRLDRDGTINKYFWDLPHHFQMLPYGSVFYRGAPAELKDIPIGTHLHGQFYLGPEGEFEVTPPVSNYAAGKMANPDLRSVESQFSRVLSLEDDFSFYQRQGASWKITAIADDLGEISVELIGIESEATQKVFRIDRGARIWKGREIGSLEDLELGQTVQLNLGWVSLLGSHKQDGICRDVWIDEESRAVATEQQRQIHLAQSRRLGVPAMVIETESMPGEGARGHATVQICAGVDQQLLDEFEENGGAFVFPVEPSLRSYGYSQPSGNFEISKIENPQPGSSGVQIRMHFYEMLEGFRAGRAVRITGRAWPKLGRPREEILNPNDLRIFEVGPKPVVDRE
ncbi:MAG: hypothetical protein ACI8UO_001356 [Verrucomicrobiales bacterium]|jgi:hypothetical protein